MRRHVLRAPTLSALTTSLLLVSLLSSMTAYPQSSDRDRPTPLTSREVVGLIRANEHQQDKYFSFYAGPGEVHITLSAENLPGKSFPVCGTSAVIFAPDAKEVARLFVQTGAIDRQEAGFALSKRTLMLLRVSPFDNGGSGGRYHIRLDGPVEASAVSTEEAPRGAATSVDAVSSSPDRDHPTALTSPEITGLIGSNEQGEDRYFKFFAGPGDLSITLDVETLRGRSFPVSGATVDLFLPDSQRVDGLFVQSSGSDEQQVKRFTLKKRVPLLLRVKAYDNGGSGGRYRIRLGGTVETAGGH